MNDVRTRGLALNIDPIGAAGYNVTLLDEYVGLWETLKHDSATLKVRQRALLHENICIDPEDSGCVCVVDGVAF